MLRARRRSHLGPSVQRAVDVLQEVGPLEPPVPEQLSVERGHDHAVPPLRLATGDRAEQSGEVVRVSARVVERQPGIVRLLGAEIHAGTAHSPELEAAGPAHLVELEVDTVAGIAFESAPHLHRGAGVAHVGGHVADAARVGHAVRLIRRALSRLGAEPGRRLVHLGVERGGVAREA